jgi:hypothetical protein
MVDIIVGTIPPAPINQGRHQHSRRQPYPKKKTLPTKRENAAKRGKAQGDGIVVTISHKAERWAQE